jgi:leucyl-tRNA synthetase
VARVGRDIERFKFNTAIAALMELARWADTEWPRMSVDERAHAARTLTLLLAPFAPHLAEELWARLGEPYSVHQQPWPSYDPTTLTEETVTVVVQVNGRLRARFQAPTGLDEGEAVRLALAADGVARHLGGQEPQQVIYVPDRLVNLVTG